LIPVRLLSLLLSLIVLAGSAQTCFAQSLAFPARLFVLPPDLKVTEAQLEALARDDAWLKLLFFTKKAFGRQQSLFDSPGFFLSPFGRSSPRLELEAILSGIFSDPARYQEAEDHPLCRFPARAAFLIERLAVDPALLPRPACRERALWIKKYNINGVAMVFSSYFTDNPASMFGHTFLKLKVNPTGAVAPGVSAAPKSTTGLLDFAVNYAAHSGDVGIFTYYWKGLSGQFPGRFAMEPFYVKVQEYNNHEQRDLWIYDLTFSPADVNRLLDIMWEIGENEINYHYFDDNCSALMLAVLDAARPDLNLYNRLPHHWIIPVDTLRVVVETPGLVGQVDYVPSTRTKFLARYDLLTAAEKTQVADQIARNDPASLAPALQQFPPERQAAVLDSLIELIDFKEDVAGAYLGDRLKDLRRQALAQRAARPEKSVKLSLTPPAEERPDRAHGTTLLSVAGGSTADAAATGQLHWRPALHGFVDDQSGFPEGLNIGFMNTRVAFDGRGRDGESPRLILRNFGGIEIKSVPTGERIIRNESWTLNVGQRHRFDCGPGGSSMCLSSYLNGGAGVSGHLFLPQISVYVMAVGQLAILHDGYRAAAAEPGVFSGLILRPARDLRISAEVQALKSFARRSVTAPVRTEINATWLLDRTSLIALYGDFESHYAGAVSLGYGFYF
jgi:hypothetical protein